MPTPVLVLGESHYLDKQRSEKASDRWYVRRELHDKETCSNINTRNAFNNAILKRKPRKSKAIFHAWPKIGPQQKDFAASILAISLLTQAEKPSGHPSG